MFRNPNALSKELFADAYQPIHNAPNLIFYPFSFLGREFCLCIQTDIKIYFVFL